MPGEVSIEVEDGEVRYLVNTELLGVCLKLFRDEAPDPETVAELLAEAKKRHEALARPSEPLSLETYEELAGAIDREEDYAVEELVSRYPWVGHWYERLWESVEADVDSGPASPALWGCEAGHPELSGQDGEAALNRAAERFGQLHNARMEVLFRWAWHCTMTKGQRCPDVPGRRRCPGDHVAAHAQAYESAIREWAASRWSMVHWATHVDEQRCLLLAPPEELRAWMSDQRRQMATQYHVATERLSDTCGLRFMRKR